MLSLFQKFLASRVSGWMALGLLLLLMGLFSYAHFKGYRACKKDTQNKQIEVMEARNEIANNRPDTRRFLDELLNDPNW